MSIEKFKLEQKKKGQGIIRIVCTKSVKIHEKSFEIFEIPMKTNPWTTLNKLNLF